MQTIGVIGAGYWGKNLIRTLSGMDSVRLKYVADRSSAVLAALATGARVRHFELARPSLHDIFVRIARPEAEEVGHA